MDLCEHMSAVTVSSVKQWQHYQTIDSTNLAALRYLRKADALYLSSAGEKPEIHTIISANEQTHGRGRMGRNWVSKRNQGLYASYICVMSRNFYDQHGAWLSTVAGIGALEALRELSGVQVQLKWPNDLYITDKKLGGILCESIVDEQAELVHVVVGIGINLQSTPNLDAHSDVPYVATSLAQWASKDIVCDDSLTRALIERIAYYLNNHLAQYDAAAMHELAKEYSATIGRHIIVQSVDGSQYEAQAIDIAADGALEVLPVSAAHGDIQKNYATNSIGDNPHSVFIHVGDVLHARLASGENPTLSINQNE